MKTKIIIVVCILVLGAIYTYQITQPQESIVNETIDSVKVDSIAADSVKVDSL